MRLNHLRQIKIGRGRGKGRAQKVLRGVLKQVRLKTIVANTESTPTKEASNFRRFESTVPLPHLKYLDHVVFIDVERLSLILIKWTSVLINKFF